MGTATSPDVVVIGGGPTGLTAAAGLSAAGFSVRVLERESEARTDWRASTFHAATLEILEPLGVVDEMHREGLVVPKYQYRDRTEGLIAEFDFGLLAEETPYPYRLQLNQQHLVRMWLERFASDPNVSVDFGRPVVGLEQDEESVTVRLADGAELTAAVAIGADGASSTVRRALDIGFEGFTYPQRFLIVSVEDDLRELIPDIADVNYVADPDEWLFLMRTRESWRAVWPVPAGVSSQDATSPEALQAGLQGISAKAGGYRVLDHQIYNVHQRVAASMRRGRALLVGDAAHINSPLGGVGLNSGIHDALDLVARLARCMGGSELDRELDRFAAVRHRVAVEYVQADTRRNTERLMERDPAVRARNREEMRAIASDPEMAKTWMRRTSLLESVRRFGIGEPATDSVSSTI